MATAASTWRDRASIGALVAGTVAVVVLVLEGPPGSGYGWGSVVFSAGAVAVLFLAMAYLVRSDTLGGALAAAALAVLAIVMFGASLLGNWASESAGSRGLDVVSTVVAVAASAVVLVVSASTVRNARARGAHPAP